MNIYDELFCSNAMLNEQIMRELESLCCECGPLFAIVDGRGNVWSGENQEVEGMLSDREHVERIISRIDDGGDPVISQMGEWGVVGTQLEIGQVECGYLLVLLPNYGPECTMANMGLIETLINQVLLIGRLIDKNNQLHRGKLKELSGSMARAR